MNSKRTLLLLILVFALLLGGAGALYRQLGQQVETHQLAQTVPSAEVPEQAPPAEAPAEEPTVEEPAEEPAEAPAEEPPAPPKAPDFIVYDLEGNPVRLSDYFGKPIVLNFWASWCYPCQIEMPFFHEKYKELGEEVHFLMINVVDGGRETLDTASAFIEEEEYTFPVFYDITTQAALTYGAFSMPQTFFIDADSNIIAHAAGSIDGTLLQQGIDMIS